MPICLLAVGIELSKYWPVVVVVVAVDWMHP